MKFLLVLAAVVVCASSEAPSYGVPQQFFQAQVAPVRQNTGYQQQEQHVPQTFKHVYVHSAPEEPEDRQARTIRVPGGDKHVNIIFVKTPSSSSSQQTEVILPEQDEHKNLVYVLLKKGEASSDIKIRKPSSRGPAKPQVYFIRYKDQPQQTGYQQQATGPAIAPVRTSQPSTQYGQF